MMIYSNKHMKSILFRLQKRVKKEEDRKKERSVHLLSAWINTREKSAFFSVTLELNLITTRLSEIYV